MLIFVASDIEHWSPLESEVRHYLAWNSIIEDADGLNLDTHQRREALRGKDQSNETLGMQLNEAYCWLLVPTQDGTDPIEWEEIRILGAQENPVAKGDSEGAKRRAVNPPMVASIVTNGHWISGLWKDESPYQPQAGVGMPCYLPLSAPPLQFRRTARLPSGKVSEHKNISDMRIALTTMDDTAGLQFGSASRSIFLDDQSVLVKPDVAKKQLEAEAEPPKTGIQK